MNNTFKKYNLCDEIIKALDGIGYKHPSDVQSKVIPEVLNGKDIIVKSQTGSGKTAAFGIPLCEKVIWEESKPQVLVLTPTRELAIQVKEELTNIGRFKRIRAVAVFGKQPFSEQTRELKQKTHIVAGTPGRVFDHIDRGTLDISNIRYLVIDEADEMLNMGFIDQVRDIINKLNKKRETMLFSATIPEEILGLCKMYMNNPINIEIKAQKLITDNITHELYKFEEFYKLDNLNKLLINEVPETSVLLCPNKEHVAKVFETLNKSGYSVSKIHRGMLQKDRIEVMEKFKRGNFKMLVSTDVAARGIDVDELAKKYVDMINLALEAKPDDMVITMHICRGNFRSTWFTSGGYEPVAKILFGNCHVDGFFLEYDSERAGGFEPLRYIQNQKVVLGLVTSKDAKLENKDEIIKRIHEAEKYVPLNQLALSPQCGFASTEEGNLLTKEEQWNKVKLVKEIAEEVWQ